MGFGFYWFIVFFFFFLRFCKSNSFFNGNDKIVIIKVFAQPPIEINISIIATLERKHNHKLITLRKLRENTSITLSFVLLIFNKGLINFTKTDEHHYDH